MSTPTTLLDLLANHSAGSNALVTNKIRSLNYETLRTLIDSTVSALNARGIGRRERVAMALPYSPEFVGCLLSISCGATCVPLDPQHEYGTLQHYLQEFNINALVVEKGSTSPAVVAARDNDIELLEVVTNDNDSIGTFQFAGAASGDRTIIGGIAESNEVAMIIDTGKNDTANMIGLSHYELVNHALGVSQIPVSENRSIFHLSGIISKVLAPLAAGKQLVFNA